MGDLQVILRYELFQNEQDTRRPPGEFANRLLNQLANDVGVDIFMGAEANVLEWILGCEVDLRTEGTHCKCHEEKQSETATFSKVPMYLDVVEVTPTKTLEETIISGDGTFAARIDLPRSPQKVQCERCQQPPAKARA